MKLVTRRRTREKRVADPASNEPEPEASLGALPDEALIARVQRGQDRAAFRELYGRHAASLLLFIKRRYGLDQQRAEDVIQETFLKVFRFLGRFDPARGVFRSWCWGIAKNCAIDLLRRQDKELLFEPDLLARERDRAQDFVESLTNLELIDTVLKSLPEDSRGMVRMRALEQKTLAEIGAAFGLSAATIHRRLTEAFEQLARLGD